MIKLFCIAIALLFSIKAFAQEDVLAPLTPYIDHYTSEMDGESRPYAVCVTDDEPGPKALMICVHPGANDLERSKGIVEYYAKTARELGKSCVVVRPSARGNGTLNMNYGEVDTFEAMEDVIAKHNIDRKRIYLFGHSMGGAATWYLSSHYPDVFAAAAPSAAYCDYRLWQKPGGWTFHMNPWEEPSWIARSAVFIPENFEHTPLYIFHGEWDRGTGAGVDVEHARQMRRVLTNLGFPPEYEELEEKGHSFRERNNEIMQEMIAWFFEQEKETNPKHVRFATYDLRHHKSYWVDIQQLITYGKDRGLVDATYDGAQTLRVTTENIQTLKLGPIPGAAEVAVTIDGKTLPVRDLSRVVILRRDDGVWAYAKVDLSDEKRPGTAGGIADLFFENLLFVQGTAGTKEETFFLREAAGNAGPYYAQRNGGVHRGGINGDNDLRFKVMNDTDLTETEMKNNNLLLFGTDKTNSIIARYIDKLPISFEDGSIQLSDKNFQGEDVMAFAIFPHPDHPERYIAIHGGITPDAISWGSHIDMGLLPDYLVYNQKEVLEWGFWGNDWESQQP